MKTIIFVLTLILCGCEGAYKKGVVLIEIGGRGEVDSITFIKDTIRVYRSHFIKDAAWYKEKKELKFTPITNGDLLRYDAAKFAIIDKQKVQSITFKYDSIMIINFDSSEVK